MSTDLIEELFSEAIEQPPERRASALSNADCSEDVKKFVRKLLVSYEQPSPFLNDDFVSDLQKISPGFLDTCLLYTSPSPRDKRQSRMPSSA